MTGFRPHSALSGLGPFEAGARFFSGRYNDLPGSRTLFLSLRLITIEGMADFSTVNDGADRKADDEISRALATAQSEWRTLLLEALSAQRVQFQEMIVAKVCMH